MLERCVCMIFMHTFSMEWMLDTFLCFLIVYGHCLCIACDKKMIAKVFMSRAVSVVTKHARWVFFYFLVKLLFCKLGFAPQI